MHVNLLRPVKTDSRESNSPLKRDFTVLFVAEHSTEWNATKCELVYVRNIKCQCIIGTQNTSMINLDYKIWSSLTSVSLQHLDWYTSLNVHNLSVPQGIVFVSQQRSQRWIWWRPVTVVIRHDGSCCFKWLWRHGRRSSRRDPTKT